MVYALTAVFLSSCAIMPLTRSFQKWQAESCGRKNIFNRICSGFVTMLTGPVILITLVADVPLTIIEFIAGIQIYPDPMVKTAMAPGEKQYFAENSGGLWEVERDAISPNRFQVALFKEGKVSKSYAVTKKLDAHGNWDPKTDELEVVEIQ